MIRKYTSLTDCQGLVAAVVDDGLKFGTTVANYEFVKKHLKSLFKKRVVIVKYYRNRGSYHLTSYGRKALKHFLASKR